MDKITLVGLQFQGRHGVYPEEKEKTQAFEVDLELMLDVRPAAQSDSLRDTVDYALVFRLVAGVVEGRSYKLIETLAEAIAAEVLERASRPGGPVLEQVMVRVRKPQAALPGPFQTVQVEIVRRRD